MLKVLKALAEHKDMSLGEMRMPEAVALLERPPVGYGKAAIVGLNGDLEHAAAVLHPKLGKPMRAAVGGGEAIIPSATKVAAAGTLIDEDSPCPFEPSGVSGDGETICAISISGASLAVGTR